MSFKEDLAAIEERERAPDLDALRARADDDSDRSLLEHGDWRDVIVSLCDANAAARTDVKVLVEALRVALTEAAVRRLADGVPMPDTDAWVEALWAEAKRKAAR